MEGSAEGLDAGYEVKRIYKSREVLMGAAASVRTEVEIYEREGEQKAEYWTKVSNAERNEEQGRNWRTNVLGVRVENGNKSKRKKRGLHKNK